MELISRSSPWATAIRSREPEDFIVPALAQIVRLTSVARWIEQRFAGSRWCDAIPHGVATYQDMPIAFGNTRCRLSGPFVERPFRMSTAIPLSALGKKVNAALEGARQFLDPNLPVPIELRGTWKSPKVTIGEDFMKKVVENAAKGGLEDLLKGLGGKKKD